MLLIKNLNRFQAFGLHLLASAGVAALSASLVFLLWYPGLLAFASGVSHIFLLLLMVDVVLGPVITLIIFNIQKKELKRDLTIVVIVQVIALLYGLHTVFITRPVYLAFNSDRFDVVYANDISAANLAKATRPEFKSLPYFGPKIIASPLPSDPMISQQIVLGVLSGQGDDVQQQPQYYVPYAHAQQKAEVLKRMKALPDLKKFNHDNLRTLDALASKYASAHTNVGYLPLKGKTHNLVVILSRTTGDVLEISELKPWK